MNSIKTTKAWTVYGTDGWESLKFHEQAPLEQLTDHDVLIRLHAVSLNYHDLITPKVSTHMYLTIFILKRVSLPTYIYF